MKYLNTLLFTSLALLTACGSGDETTFPSKVIKVEHHTVGFINPSGHFVISPNLRWAGGFVDGLAKVDSGFMNKSGKVVIKGKFDSVVANFHEDMLAISSYGPAPYKCSYLNTKGEIAFSLMTNDGNQSACRDFSSGYAVYGTAIYDKSGKRVLDDLANLIKCPASKQYSEYTKQWSPIEASRQNLLILNVNAGVIPYVNGCHYAGFDEDYSGLLDLTGKRVMEHRFSVVSDFYEGLGYLDCKKECESGFIDKTGKLIYATHQEQPVHRFREGMAAVKENGLWGFIDTSGKLVIAAKYDEVNDFREGRAAAKTSFKFGYLDKLGKFAISPDFAEAGPFVYGLALIQDLDYKKAYINRSGKRVYEDPTVSWNDVDQVYE